MEQLPLFAPQSMALRELQSVILELRLAPATAALEHYSNTWGPQNLTWEPVLLAGLKEACLLPDLDSACDAWESLEHQVRLPGNVSRHDWNLARQNFFSTMLNRIQPAEPRTPKGRSVGHLWFLAGDFRRAEETFEHEIATEGDEPVTRVRLGNVHFACGKKTLARRHYREAVFAGLRADDLGTIEDQEVVEDLCGPGEMGWLAVQACMDAHLPVEQFSSREEFVSWLRNSGRPFGIPHGETATQESNSPREFYVCLVVCANRQFSPEDLLIRARLHMKKQSKTRQQERERAEREDREAIEDAFRMFDIAMEERESVGGRSAIRFSFKPRPGAKPVNGDGKILRNFSGRVWFDEATRELARLEIEAVKDVSIGLGLVARLRKGAHGVIERKLLNNEVWLPSRTQFTGNLRVLLLKSMNMEVSDEFFDYRKFSVETSVTYPTGK